jgi:hypothetical protein
MIRLMMFINISRLQHQIIGWSANNEFERSKKAVLAQHEALSQHSPGMNDKNYEQPFRKSDLQGKTWTQNVNATQPNVWYFLRVWQFSSCEVNPLQGTLCETALHITGHHLWLTEWQTNKFTLTHSLILRFPWLLCDVWLQFLAIRCTECWFPNISAYTALSIFRVNVLGGLLCWNQNRWWVECEDMNAWTAPLVASNCGLSSESMPTSRSVQRSLKPPAQISALKMAAADICWNWKLLTFYTASSQKQKSYVNKPTTEPI